MIIEDEPCKVCISFLSDILAGFWNILFIFGRMFQDEHGNIITNDDGEPLIHTYGTGLISFDLAVKCPTNVFNGNFLKAHEHELQVLSNPLFPTTQFSYFAVYLFIHYRLSITLTMSPQ